MFPMKGSYEGRKIEDVKQYKVDIRPSTVFSNQYVDVIIPYHGQYERVATLVQSLIYKTRSNPFRVCLVDDGSPNRNFLYDAFDQFVNIKQVQNETQIGVEGSLFKGLQAMTYEPNGLFPYIAFMTPEVVIEDPNWLLGMGQTLIQLKDTAQVKMVGAKTTSKSGPPFILAENLTDQDYILKDDEFLPIYCNLCHKELFRKIGGFFNNPQELAYRMYSVGYRQAVSSRTWVG